MEAYFTWSTCFNQHVLGLFSAASVPSPNTNLHATSEEKPRQKEVCGTVSHARLVDVI